VDIMFGILGRAVLRHPWYVIIGWLLAATAILALAPAISSVTNADQSAMLPAGAESARAARLAATAFPDRAGATAVIVVRRADGAPLSGTDLGAVADLATRLGATPAPGLAGTSFDRQQSTAPSRAVALVAVAFRGPAEQRQVRDAVTAVRARTTRLLTGTGLVAGMTGPAAIAVDNTRALHRAETVVMVATLILILILLGLVFRSPAAALLPVLTIGLVYAVSSALVATAAHLLHTQVGQELPTMLTVVLFGVGTDYILFLLFRYRERLRAGDSPGEAIAGAVERVGEAVGFAALAVIVAFGALALASLRFFSTLGPALAVGVAVTLLAALTLVPAVVSVLGRLVFWPVRPARRAARRGVFTWLGALVAGRPVLVVAGSVALLAALAAGLAALRPSYDPIAQLPAGTESGRAYADLRRGFPAGALNPTDVYLHGPARLSTASVTAFTGRLASVAGVAGVGRPTISADGATARVPVVLAAGPYSPRALDLVSGPLREQARGAAPPGTTVAVGGTTMGFADIREHTNSDLNLVFPVAAAAFMIILAGLLRAAVAPFYLVVLVVTGFAAALGGSAWIFGGGLAFSIPIILYLFVTAIGTDYNILVTARLRDELREGRSPRAAARLAVERAGPSVVCAAAILAGTFASLLIPGVPFFTQIGISVTLGIAIVAMVVSLLLVPALTGLLGRVAWWPRRPPRPSVVINEYTEGNVKAWGGSGLG
jgi:putative drug exporter of the RND superfamily